jgi:hypothetical protein
MKYGPGASLNLWKKVLEKNRYDLWFAELSQRCVDNYQLQLDGVQILVGDQGNITTLQAWVRQSKGNFDVIIDDGGHKNSQIMASLTVLWSLLKPGGYYFLEDLHVGRKPGYFHPHQTPPVTIIIQTWIDHLNIGAKYPEWLSPHAAELIARYPLPHGLEGIFCQLEACVLMKSHGSADAQRNT